MNKNPQYNLKSSQKLKVLFILIISFLICQSIYSQFTWQRTYHAVPDGDEEAFDICEADNNNYYIGGITAPFFRKAYILKINGFGDTIWTRTYFDGEIYTLAPTNDGGCIFAGYSGGAFACRIKSNGDTLWLKSFSAVNFLDIKKTIEGNYILCGVEYSNDRYNGYICKIDTSGNIIWERVYPANISIDFFTIESDVSGGFIAGGIKRDIPGGPRFSYLCKINDTGAVIWDKNYLLSNDNYVSSIQQSSSGYIFTGRSLNNVYLQKINVNGDSIQTYIVSNTNNVSTGPVLLKYNNNKYYLAHVNGLTSRVYSIDSNLYINRQLTLQILSPKAVYLSSIINVSTSSVGDLICIGSTDYYQFANLDLYAVRLDSSLTMPPPLGIVNTSNNIPIFYYLFQNYPNPFNPVTRIKFSVPRESKISLRIFDIKGSLAAELYNGNINAGFHEFEWNAESFASGVYLYALESNDYKEMKKMVLIK